MAIGGLTQISIPEGNINNYLTIMPEITLFKTVYKRHTNFSYETIVEPFRTQVSFGKQARCDIKPIGDLITHMTLNIHIDSINTEEQINYGWTNSLGHAVIKSLWIEIGGKQIDKQYGEWLELWTELTQPYDKRLGYFQMINKVDFSSYSPSTFTDSVDIYVPLNFFFCKNYGLALPILSLYNHKIELIVEFRNFDECWVFIENKITSPKKPYMNCDLLIDYIWLDNDERQKFLNSSHVYLIEEIQASNNILTPNSCDLYFNHSIKELVWILQKNSVTLKPTDKDSLIGNDWFNYSTSDIRNNLIQDPFTFATIQINGTDIFTQLKASYFRLLQPYYHHTRIPTNYIYTYSFALRPEELQPTGQINFSMVENVRLVLNGINNNDKYTLRCYAVNYNIFIVCDGIGSILYT